MSNITINTPCEKKNVSIEEMRKSCNVIWGEWLVGNWSDVKIKKMYKLYKEGYFNLR